MFDTFKATLTPMLVLFLCMVIGFVLKKKALTPDNTATVLSKLENYVLVPALIINTFMKYCTVASIKEQYTLILYCLLALTIAVVIALFLSRFFADNDAYQRNIYIYALTFGNFSFMGNAIVPAIFGDEMLYKYMLFILPLNFAVYTWGMAILVPRSELRGKPLKNLLNPIFFSLLIGAFLGLTGVGKYIPVFVTNTISNCAACMGPLAMVLTGFVIGEYKISSLLKNKRVYLATALRLLILPALFLGIAKLCGADGTTLTCMLFAFATPLGLNTVVFPAAYGGDTRTGASMAMISHSLCVITIPLMYALLSLIL